jgi:hypothetical protein
MSLGSNDEGCWIDVERRKRCLDCDASDAFICVGKRKMEKNNAFAAANICIFIISSQGLGFTIYGPLSIPLPLLLRVSLWSMEVTRLFQQRAVHSTGLPTILANSRNLLI